MPSPIVASAQLSSSHTPTQRAAKMTSSPSLTPSSSRKIRPPSWRPEAPSQSPRRHQLQRTRRPLRPNPPASHDGGTGRDLFGTNDLDRHGSRDNGSGALGLTNTGLRARSRDIIGTTRASSSHATTHWHQHPWFRSRGFLHPRVRSFRPRRNNDGTAHHHRGCTVISQHTYTRERPHHAGHGGLPASYAGHSATTPTRNGGRCSA